MRQIAMPQRGHLALYVVTPVLVFAAALSGVVALRAQTPQVDAARALRTATTCAPKIAFSGGNATPSPVSAGQNVALTIGVRANCSTTALIDYAVYNASGTLAYQNWLSSRPVSTTARSFTVTWPVPATEAAGTYTLQTGVFSTSWKTLYGWDAQAATVQVRGASVSTPTPAPTTAPTPPTPIPATPTPTATATQPSGGTPPPQSGAGATLPPGATLPTEAQCVQSVPASTWEPRPDNYTANHSVPTAQQIAAMTPWGPAIGMDAKSDSIRQQITGNYTGTTDQILQWVGCKWGIDPNIVRAEAVSESYWHQSQLGDITSDTSVCPPGAAYNGSQCYQSYGILQIKYQYFKSEFPMARNDTAYNAEVVYGWLRNCYEGWADYLYQETPVAGYPAYHAGDIWGCVGFWYSGSWYSQDAITYINGVKQHYANQDWLKPGF